MAQPSFLQPPIELALPDGPILARNDIEPLTCKLGGKPIWLAPYGKAPANEHIRCGVCGSQMYMLVQLDCPHEDSDVEYERYVYVFACNTRTCSFSTYGWKAFVLEAKKTLFKGQSEAETCTARKFWDTTAADSDDTERVDFSELLARSVPSPKDVKDLGERISKQLTLSADATEYPCAFPAYYLHIVEETIVEVESARLSHRKNTGSAPVTPDSSAAEGWMEEAYEKHQPVHLSKAFKTFQRRAAHYPRQCARICYGGSPLVYNDEPIPKIPSCPACRRPRLFELQLMPAILALLPTDSDAYTKHIPSEQKSKHPLLGDGMDWGTALVYTCGALCRPVSDYDAIPFDIYISEGFVVPQLEKD